jgi:hypothetical protein
MVGVAEEWEKGMECEGRDRGRVTRQGKTKKKGKRGSFFFILRN